jgi:ABC-type transport system involved in cytochrome c biogenesis permease subunit
MEGARWQDGDRAAAAIVALGGILIAAGSLFEWLRSSELSKKGIDFSAGKLGIAFGIVTVAVAVATFVTESTQYRALGAIAIALGLGAVALAVWGHADAKSVGETFDELTRALSGSSVSKPSSVGAAVWVMGAGGIVAVVGGSMLAASRAMSRTPEPPVGGFTA